MIQETTDNRAREASDNETTVTEAAAVYAPPPAAPGARRGGAISSVVSRAICLTITLVASALLVRLFVIREPVQIHWTLQITLGALAMSSSLFVAVHQWRFWTVSVRQMKEILPLIRNGEAAIEELNRVRGGLTVLVPVIAEVCRELRKQKSRISQMEAEMSQRVAKRTDALERTLGSLRQQAAKDALTGLYNRRMLDEMVPKVLKQCRLEGSLLCILMIDVDDFKLLNDTLGHQAGDTLLRSLGQIIRSTIREADLAFRYGGDEFVIALPGCQRKDGEILQARLASLMDGLIKPLRVPRPPRLSIGLIALNEVLAEFDGEPTAATLMRLADGLLYNNKVARKAAGKTAESKETAKRVA